MMPPKLAIVTPGAPAAAAGPLEGARKFMEHSHAFQLPLYGALALGDLAEAHHQRREGGSGLLPLAGAGALGLMAAPHALGAMKTHAPNLYAKANTGMGKIMGRLKGMIH